MQLGCAHALYRSHWGARCQESRVAISGLFGSPLCQPVARHPAAPSWEGGRTRSDLLRPRIILDAASDQDDVAGSLGQKVLAETSDGGQATAFAVVRASVVEVLVGRIR